MQEAKVYVLVKTESMKGCCYFVLIKTLFLFATCLLLLSHFPYFSCMYINVYCQVVVKLAGMYTVKLLSNK